MPLKKLFYLTILLLAACSSKNPTTAFFKSMASNDVPLRQPKEGEWLYEHKEPGQNVEEYKKAKPVSITPTANTIFIKPYGQFSEAQNKVLQYTIDYLTIFFQIKTVLLPTSTDSIFPDSARRTRANGNEQLLASYILNPVLKNSFPAHGIAYMAITEKDLYPSASWNYVFGLASYEDKIGVSSIKRLTTKVIDAANYQTCLRRLIQVASHEIGHMFSLHHCIHAYCTMNGSNNLTETDAQPNRLCSECLKKLSWNLKFDNKKRLTELQDYFLKHKIKTDYQLMVADYEVL